MERIDLFLPEIDGGGLALEHAPGHREVAAFGVHLNVAPAPSARRKFGFDDDVRAESADAALRVRVEH